MISPLFFVDSTLYIDSERNQSPLSHNKKYWLLTVTLKYMDAQGHTNIVQKPRGIYTECSFPTNLRSAPKQLSLYGRISKLLSLLWHKKVHANMHWNNKILKRLWNINVNFCYICLLLIELLPRMLVLWRIICQCKTSNGPIYWLLQAVEFQQSLINLFRSVSLEIQRGELHSRENISSS